ncbi:MAG TPA: hypothetical protein VM261_09090, partial [Kofleriaceae bacterium]|nr:hypothetical protein [Kofleriaceae bacterium]
HDIASSAHSVAVSRRRARGAPRVRQQQSTHEHERTTFSVDRECCSIASSDRPQLDARLRRRAG